VFLLALDTATPRVSVAIGSGGALLGEVNLVGGRRHAEQLAPAIRYLCDELNLDLEHVAGVAVGLGPGLFTGLRVGVTTAKVMAQALRVPVVGISSLDLVAYPARHTTRLIAAVLDARRKEVFHARYRPVPGGVQRVSDYAVDRPEEVVADLAAGGDEVLLVGDGAHAYPKAFDDLDRVEHAGPGFIGPSAAALVDLATARIEREEFGAPWDIRPIYLRGSDAEIEWDRRAS
jgi:tRNA threonylcarbamoyladenosine biosynthesis protein TsaB